MEALEGIPLGVKDLLYKDVRTTACSHILENFVPYMEIFCNWKTEEPLVLAF